MDKTGHRINKLVFETRAVNPHDISAFNERIRNHFDTIISPAIESVLDSIDQAAKIIRMDRIEIDLGSIDDDPETLGEKLKAALLDALPNQIITALSLSTHSTEEELIHFLQTGNLRWSEPGQAHVVLTQDLMRWSNTDFSTLCTRLRILLLRKATARRLIWQMPYGFVRRVLHTLADAQQITVSDETDYTSEKFLTGPQTEIAYTLLQNLIRGQAKTLSSSSIQASFSALNNSALNNIALQKSEHFNAAEVLENEPQQPEHLRVDPEPDHVHNLALDTEINTDTDTALNKQQVFAAGAVLLHPFLSPFYDQLGLLDPSGQFSNQQSRVRAALITHYLATGNLQAAEPEMTIFKLLCGLPLTHPVPRETLIQSSVEKEADKLLLSMIQHWKRLGKTSPEGLRSSFLNRPGILQKTTNGWLLNIEQRSIDILLDHLPWTLSRIKTRFMSELLTVDWR